MRGMRILFVVVVVAVIGVSLLGCSNFEARKERLDAPWEGSYVVKEGDTLVGIAAKYLTSPGEIRDHNPILKDRDKDLLYVGETLKVPN